MPIQGLSNRGLSFPQIGDIRKGAPKDPAKNMPGRDLHWFRVNFDAQEEEAAKLFLETFKPEPTDIDIVLPFDEIERCWDPWCEAYTAGRMVARSDGEYFVYWQDLQTGELKVQNGLDKDGKPVPHQEVVGKAGKTDIKCRPVGRLKVIIPALRRAAYLVVHTTSVIDIRNISEQLAAIQFMNGGHIAGVPLVLRRRPKMVSCPDSNDPGKKVRREKWMISIEADPKWVALKLTQMDRAALPEGSTRLALPAVEEEDIDGDWTEQEGAPTGNELAEQITLPDAVEEPEQDPTPATLRDVRRANWPDGAKVTYETAEGFIRSDNSFYIDTPIADLLETIRAIEAKLKANKLTQEVKDDLAFRVDVAKACISATPIETPI